MERILASKRALGRSSDLAQLPVIEAAIAVGDAPIDEQAGHYRRCARALAQTAAEYPPGYALRPIARSALPLSTAPGYSAARPSMGSVRMRLACLLACVCALVSLRAEAQPQAPRLQLDTEALQIPAAPAAEPAAAAPDEAAPPGEAPAARAVAAADDDACQRVVNIRFMGLRRVNAEDLNSSVRVRTGECLDRARAARDARTLWDLGFFRDVRVGVERAEGGVEVRYHVSERPTVHAVRFEGYDDVDEDKLRETIDIRDGSVLSESAIRRNVQKLLDLYEEKGFFLARVTHAVEARTGDRNEVDIVFRIVEGTQVQVRSVQFIGNHSLTDDELRGVMSTNTSGFFSFRG